MKGVRGGVEGCVKGRGGEVCEGEGGGVWGSERRDGYVSVSRAS